MIATAQPNTKAPETLIVPSLCAFLQLIDTQDDPSALTEILAPVVCATVQHR